ncbi:MAG TPA: hypothetical protein DEQ61_12855, partial [Streptomyces sp.]|nr:hypothetical protein [Streptomyces sp.]
ERRRRTAGLVESAPRPRLHRVAANLLPLWLAAVAAYLVTWLVLIVLTWPNASAYGHPPAGPLLADLAAVAAFTCGGYLIGWYVPWWSPAPLVAVGGYTLLVMWGLYAGSGLAELMPTAPGFRTGQESAGWADAAHTAWFGGLAAALFLAVGAVRKWLLVLPLVVAVCGAVPLLDRPDEVWVPDRAGAVLVCEGERPQICLRRAHESRRNDLTGPVRWAYALFEGAATVPVRFEERGPAGRSSGASGEASAGPSPVTFAIVSSGELGSDSRLDYFQRDAVLQDLLRWDCETEPGAPPWNHEILLWAHWQWPGAMDGMERGPVVRTLDAMDRHERAAWFTDYFAAARSCDARLVDRP